MNTLRGGVYGKGWRRSIIIIIIIIILSLYPLYITLNKKSK